MPGKKHANMALITDPAKTQYIGFVDDVNELFEITRGMELGTKIDSIINEISPMIESIQIPEGAKAGVKKKLEDKKKALNDLVAQLNSIKDIADGFVTTEKNSYSTLNRAMKWENADPRNDNDKLNESLYKEYMDTLRIYPKELEKIFTNGAAEGMPVNIRGNLDKYKADIYNI